MQEMQLLSLGQEDPLEKEMAAHCGAMDISRTQASDLRQQGWWGCLPGWGPGWSFAAQQAAQGRPIPHHRSISLSGSPPPWSEIGWSARFLLHGYVFLCDVISICALPSYMVSACWGRALYVPGMISKLSGSLTVGKAPSTGPPLTLGLLDPYPWSAVSEKQSLDCFTLLWN